MSTDGVTGRAPDLPDSECLKREPVCKGCGYEPPDCTCGVSASDRQTKGE